MRSSRNGSCRTSVVLNLEGYMRVPFFKGGHSRNKYHVQKYRGVKENKFLNEQ